VEKTPRQKEGSCQAKGGEERGITVPTKKPEKRRGHSCVGEKKPLSGSPASSKKGKKKKGESPWYVGYCEKERTSVAPGQKKKENVSYVIGKKKSLTRRREDLPFRDKKKKKAGHPQDGRAAIRKGKNAMFLSFKRERQAGKRVET